LKLCASEGNSKPLDIFTGLANDLPSPDMGDIPLFICNRPKCPTDSISHPRMTHVDSPIALRDSARLKELVGLARVPLMEDVTILAQKGFDKFLHFSTRHYSFLS